MDKPVEQQAWNILAESLNVPIEIVGRYDDLPIDDAIRAIARALTRPAPTEAEVEAAAKRMAELCSPPKGASFEDACEWVPPTIEDLARAALGVVP